MGNFWLPDAPGVKTGMLILEARFPSIRVSDRMPKSRPAQIILLTQVDGSRPNPVQSIHRLLIELWASPLLVDLQQWAGEVSAALRNSAGSNFGGVSSCGWSNQHGPVDFPDPDVADMDRWQLHGDLKLSTK